MKVERIVTDSVAISNSITAEKIIKEEKQVLSTDAVTLDLDKNNQNQQQNQDKSEKKDKDRTEEHAVFAKDLNDKDLKNPVKKLDILA